MDILIYINYLIKIVFCQSFKIINSNSKFIKTKERDFDMVILKESGWINYTKLCKNLTGNEDKFRSLVNKNTSLQILIKNYENLRPENSPVLKSIFC